MNVAFNKSTTQVTEPSYLALYVDEPPDLAVDGITTCDSFWHTYIYSGFSQWQVDLGIIFDINNIAINGKLYATFLGECYLNSFIKLVFIP